MYLQKFYLQGRNCVDVVKCMSQTIEAECSSFKLKVKPFLGKFISLLCAGVSVRTRAAENLTVWKDQTIVTQLINYSIMSKTSTFTIHQKQFRKSKRRKKYFLVTGEHFVDISCILCLHCNVMRFVSENILLQETLTFYIEFVL